LQLQVQQQLQPAANPANPQTLEISRTRETPNPGKPNNGSFSQEPAPGAALMLSLWAFILLSAMVISWTLDISSRLALSGKANRILEAEAMACSGAEVAMHPQTKPDSEVLRGRFGKGQSYEARLTGRRRSHKP